MTDDATDEPLYAIVRRARREGDVLTLIEALDDDIEARVAAVYLGELGDDTAVPALVPLLSSRDPHKRASAATALGRLGAQSVAGELAVLVRDDPVGWVRSCALSAVAAIDNSAAYGPAITALRDRDIRVRRAAVAALMQAGRREAMSSLEEARRSEPWYGRGPYRRALRRLDKHS